MNMVRHLGDRERDSLVIHVYTTAPPEGIARFEESPNGRVRIFRIGKNDAQRNFLVRYLSYGWYYLFSLVHCLFHRPGQLLYIDTMSAPVPLFLKKFVWRGLPLFIHYHEYMSQKDYSLWPLAGLIHKWERRMYKKVKWLSQTNEDRMQMFLSDHGMERSAYPVRIMPNYPRRAWAGDHAKKAWTGSLPLRLVYIGAVDLANICFGEFIDWIESQEGRFVLDVLSNQDVGVVREYAQRKGARFVEFKGSVPYYKLPEVLARYDVGLILYRGNTENFMYNAPNKLFEYLAVGLDVWFPAHLKGVKPYANEDTHPMVLPMDILDMQSFRATEIYAQPGKPFRRPDYFAEEVYDRLAEAMFDENEKRI